MTSYRHGINTLALTVTVVLYMSSANVPTVEGFTATTTNAPSIMTNRIQSQSQQTIMMMTSADDEEESADTELPVSGSFFNEVPPPKQDDESDSSTDNIIDDGGTISESESSNILESDFPLTSSTSSSSTTNFDGDDTDMFQQIIQNTKLSTSSSGKGFSKTTSTTDHTSSTLMQTPGSSKPFVGIGKPANDVSNPEYDENGYTVYTDETTGKKSRVFDALVEYPSIFKMKIVGSDDDDPNRGDFESEIVDVVAKSCGVDRSMVKHTHRKNGKWISVTVYAPVASSDMLYSLYENVDKDDRVKVRIYLVDKYC